MEQITCRPKRPREDDPEDRESFSSDQAHKRNRISTERRVYSVTRQAADNANGSGGLSDLIILPPTVAGGSFFTVFRRIRPTFSSSVSLLSTCDVDAPLRCEFNTETLTHSVHTIPVRQFRVVPDRPNFNYAVSSVDGTDHPRIYFCIRDNAVVDCAVAGTLNPALEAGWVCEMINEVCSCRTVPDRDFVVVLCKKAVDQAEELARVSLKSLTWMYSGKLVPSPSELREYHPSTAMAADGSEPLFIPTKNMWNGMLTGRMGPCEERFGRPVKQRKPMVSAPLLELMPEHDMAVFRSLRNINSQDPGNAESTVAVYVPLNTELGYDTATRYMCDGSIVLTKIPEVHNYVLNILESSGLPAIKYVDDVRVLDSAMIELLGENLDVDRAVVYAEAAKRFSYQWLDVSCTMDNIADSIAAAPAPPPAANGWSPNWVVQDETRRRVCAIERRAGSLGIGTFSICFPIPFTRFSDEDNSRLTLPADLQSSLSSRGSQLAALVGAAKSVDTFSDKRLSKLTQRADGRPGPSQYEALSGLLASGEIFLPDSMKDSTLKGMAIKAAVYPRRDLGSRAAYAGVACVNDLCRECDAFLYTVGGGSLSHLEINSPYVVYTEPLPIGSVSLYAYVEDVTVPLKEKESVLSQLRLVLEWAYDRYEFLHNKLDPTKTIFVGPRPTVGVVTTSLRFSNQAVGTVTSTRQVYVVDYSRSTYKYCLSSERSPKVEVTAGRDSFLAVLPRLHIDTRTPVTDKISAEKTRYTRDKEGTLNTKFDRLPAELYLTGFWGSTLLGGIRRYANRLHYGRVGWMDCHTDDSRRLGKARIQEIGSIERIVEDQDDLRRNENIDRVLKKLKRVYSTCVGGRS